MLLDQNCMLSDKQAVTATAASANVIDQGAAGDSRAGLYVYCKTDEAFAGLTGLKIALQTADNSAFTSPKTLMSLDFTVADLTADKELFKAVLPLGCLRFVRGYYTVTGTGTAGKVSLFLTDGVEQR